MITLIYNVIILDKIPYRTIWSEFSDDPKKVGKRPFGVQINLSGHYLIFLS